VKRNKIVNLARAALFLAGAVSLAACGRTTQDRALSGAGAGAATGAGIGALAGGLGAVPGALIGAAVGGGIGAATDEETLNLGRPLWRR
jgi:osmotically inducible lipoprotein OsmB